MAAAQDRRSHARIAFRIPAHITRAPDEGRIYRGYVMNLSQTGAFVMMDETVELDPTVRISFHIKPATDCEASGHIVRMMPMGVAQGFGIELTWYNPEFSNFLRNLEAASEIEALDFIRDIGRIYVRVGA